MKTALSAKTTFFLILSFFFASVLGIAQTTPSLHKNATPVKPILPSVEFKNATPVKPKDGGLDGSPSSSHPPAVTGILSKDQMVMLHKVAAAIKENPEGRIKISGHGAATKDEQQRSWEKVNAIIRYLVEKEGISNKRFIFDYGSEGNNNVVDISFTDEDGPTSLPAPHPNLRS